MVGGTAHSLLALAACVPLALREARVFSTQAGSAAELAEASAAAACGLNPVGSAAALGEDRKGPNGGGGRGALCDRGGGGWATPRTIGRSAAVDPCQALTQSIHARRSLTPLSLPARALAAARD